ncbi:MAG TPA: PAS domain S-box protein [Burkholderiales bacterium]|nr:PAS domain S-box protein [Burkholderiales bacterium]
MKLARTLPSPNWRAVELPDIVLLLSALLLVVFGGMMVRYWHSPQVAWDVISFPLQKISYDSAWGFLLCGCALFSFVARQRMLTKIIAAAVVIIAALRLGAYLVPGIIPIYPIVASPLLPATPDVQFAMEPYRAVIFFVAGIALAMLSRTPRSIFSLIVIALMASVIVMLALLQLFGYWGPNRFIGVWQGLNGGGTGGSVNFIVLGAALLFFIFFSSGRKYVAARKWAPVPVWFGVFIASLALAHALNVQESGQIRFRTELVAANVTARIENEVETRILQLQRLASRWQIYDASYQEWQHDAESLLSDFPDFRAIGWINPNRDERWVLPKQPAGVTATAAIPVMGPSDRITLQAALTRRKIMLTPFKALRDGGKGFDVYVPVYVDNHYVGTITGIVREANLADVLGANYPDYSASLLENGQVINYVGSQTGKVGQSWRKALPVTLHNVRWEIQVAPARSAIERANWMLPLTTLLAGTLLGTLLAWLLYLLQKARAQAGEIDAANRQLRIDINARRNAERTLREREELNHQIVNAVKDYAIFMLDPVGRIRSWNAGAEKLTGYGPITAIGQPFSMLYPDDVEQPPENRLRIAAAMGQCEEEAWHVRRDGSRYCAESTITANRNEAGVIDGFSVVLRDMTERQMMQAALERSRDESRALTRYVQSVREDEKSRIAREIHDELGSTLTAVRMDIRALSGKRALVDTALHEKMNDMVALVDSAIRVTRRIATELRPTILDDLGLIAALRWQAGEYQKRTGILTTIEFNDPNVTVDKQRGIVFFRIFQEALTNVAKHAQAKNVRTRFDCIGSNYYVLTISDDGSGVPAGTLLGPTSHGIRGMRERAEEFQGTFTIHSAPGEGTTITVRMPVSMTSIENADDSGRVDSMPAGQQG